MDPGHHYLRVHPQLSGTIGSFRSRKLMFNAPMLLLLLLVMHVKCVAQASGEDLNAAVESGAESGQVVKDAHAEWYERDVSSRPLSVAGRHPLEAAQPWILQDFRRTLDGSGAHRTLISVVTVSTSSGEVQRMSETCRLRLVERLPPGAYADQFELQGILRRGGFMEARIHGDVNLERPALLSSQSIVDIHVALLEVASDGHNDSRASLQAEVALPLHARYPPLSVDSHRVVHIPMPDIFVSCRNADEGCYTLPVTEQWKQVSLGHVTESETSSGVLDWMVPAGNPGDYSFVARFTAIAALSGVLVVFSASVAAEQRK